MSQDSPKIFVDPDEIVDPEIYQRIESDIVLSDPVRQDPAGSPGAPQTPPTLPVGGTIPAKGPVDDFSGCTDGCSCQTVTLVRVETKDYVRTVGSFILGTEREIYDVKKIFDINDPALPPQSGPLRIPARDYRDSVCFYFSYPPCFAYYGRRGRRHPCLAKVEISYPHFVSGAPNFVSVYQLYSVRGVAEFATGTRNVVCLRVPLPNRIIPAGTGTISWSVRDTTCQSTVNFTFF